MSLQERKRFQYFFNTTEKEEGTYVFYLEDDDDFLLGKEAVIEDGYKIVYYFWPLRDNEFLLMMCIDQDADLDDILNEYTEYDLKILRRPWPNLVDAIQNGINGRLHLPSLMSYEIHSKKSYFTSVLLSNVSKSEIISETKYVSGKVVDLMKYTMDLISEISDNEPSMWEIAKMSIKSGLDQYRVISRIVRVINNL